MRKNAWRVVGAVFGGICCASAALAQDAGAAGAAAADSVAAHRAVGLGASAAFVAAISILGAGYAVGHVGSAALGVVAEKPEQLPRTILFVALAEGLAVLGFAVAMMLLQKM